MVIKLDGGLQLELDDRMIREIIQQVTESAGRFQILDQVVRDWLYKKARIAIFDFGAGKFGLMQYDERGNEILRRHGLGYEEALRAAFDLII